MGNNFLELKQRKERGITNEQFFDDAKATLIDSESIVIVGMDKQGLISTYYTHSGALHALGLLEVAKQDLIQEMET